MRKPEDIEEEMDDVECELRYSSDTQEMEIIEEYLHKISAELDHSLKHWGTE